jgi:hypothetical protein
MRYSFRLAELLGHNPDPRRRPGTIKAIVEYTGLDRHQVAALLKNEVKYIPLKALSRLCDYLVEHGHTTADRLPGALFAIEPESFWEVLARRARLEFCLGVRKDVDSDSPEVSYVVASDAVLFGELLNGVTTLGGTAKLRSADASTDRVELPHPEHLKQSLVWSPGQAPQDEVTERARQIYDDFLASSGDKGLVGLGSTKSNPVVEMILSQAFGCEAFQSQDSVRNAQDRSCPFFLRYRAQDPNAASCFGGMSLSADEKTTEPGIYYEDAKGRWVSVPCGSNRQDAAFLFFVHRESQGQLEMALGGFSGRATRMLARTLSTRSEDFWPPQYEGQGLQIGAYVIQFSWAEQDRPIDILRTDLNANTRVIPIPTEAIARRVEGQH